nr:MAG TPA: hypothetical protein [Caudoviricetes sp.]
MYADCRDRGLFFLLQILRDVLYYKQVLAGKLPDHVD